MKNDIILKRGVVLAVKTLQDLLTEYFLRDAVLYFIN